jgi:hypothetical protein
LLAPSLLAPSSKYGESCKYLLYHTTLFFKPEILVSNELLQVHDALRGSCKDTVRRLEYAKRNEFCRRAEKMESFTFYKLVKSLHIGCTDHRRSTSMTLVATHNLRKNKPRRIVCKEHGGFRTSFC